MNLLPDPFPINNDILEEVGFGYDSEANEYKVVRITKKSITVKDDYNYKAGIYTLNRYDCWREIEMPIKVHSFTTKQVRAKEFIIG